MDMREQATAEQMLKQAVETVGKCGEAFTAALQLKADLEASEEVSDAIKQDIQSVCTRLDNIIFDLQAIEDSLE